ncbi:MAG: DUF4339 domain-containing protein [Waddliaceae bacterium]
MYQEWILLLLLTSIAFLASYLASKKGRNPYAWFAIGFLLGILGVLLLLLLPSLNEEDQNDEDQDDEEEVLEEGNVYWYYLDSDHEEQGPISETALKEKIQARELLSSDYVWKQGLKEWEMIENFPGLLTD